MAEFKKSYGKTKIIEGAYANDKADHGGETYKGVSRRAHPTNEIWPVIDIHKNDPDFPACLERIPGLQAGIELFYRQNYWNVHNLDLVTDQAIADALFDAAVNCGNETAVKWLQRVLNVTNLGGKRYPELITDGIIGSKCVDAINHHPYPELLLKGFNGLRIAYYISLAEKDKSQEQFIRSWFSRV